MKEVLKYIALIFGFICISLLAICIIQNAITLLFINGWLTDSYTTGECLNFYASLLVGIGTIILGIVTINQTKDANKLSHRLLDKELLDEYCCIQLKPKIDLLIKNNENNKNEKEEKPDATKNNNVKENTATENVTNVEQVEKTKDPTFVNPVDGEKIKDYSSDNLVYSVTLDEWTTHLGIDYKSEKTDIVKASADGKIKSIKNDPRYGLTVVIEHTNGFESVYSNLLTAEFITVGEEVKQGQTIATVGNTARFEIADETHLHFEIKQNGENVDPNIYLK